MLSTSQFIFLVVLPTYAALFSAGYLIARWNREHPIVTLGLGPRVLASNFGSPTEGLRILLGFLVLVFLLPLLPIVALVSIPFAKIAGVIQSRREIEFATRMRSLGRTIAWTEVEQHAIAKEGTLVWEIFGMNGGSRIWWTPEILGNLTSLPYARSGVKDKFCFEKEFEEFGKWCFENYTDPNSGRAMLVEVQSKHQRRFWKRINDIGFEYLITHYRAKEKVR